jgi:transposase
MEVFYMKEIKFKRGINPNQEYLYPKKPSDLLPENHLGRAIYEVVELLDTREIESKYSEKGQHAYHPKMMIKIIFNGYSVGIRSSRKISRACEERFDFVYLADGLKPSHDRVSDFRKDNLEGLKELFKEIVIMGATLGLVQMNNINTSIDGTKVRASASAKLTKDEEGLQRLLDKTKAEIDKWFEEAEQTDAEEDEKYGKGNRGDELPEHLRSKESRKKAIESALKKLRERKEFKKELIREEKKREPTQRELKEVENMKINVTDNDAKFMQERNGVIKPNYNAQLSVDEQEQFILANDVVDECTDCHQLVPMTQQTKENIGVSPKQVKSDNGYYPQLEKATALFPEIVFYVDDKNRRKDYINFYELRQKYSDAKYENLIRIVSPDGENVYKKRMHTVEPPIGNLKHNLGYRYFLLRGINKVKGEFNLMCIAHNIKKIFRFLAKKGIDLALALKFVKENVRNTMNIERNLLDIKEVACLNAFY